MEIKTLEDIKELVKEYGEGEIQSTDGNAYFIISKKLADEVDGWLWEYSYSKDGDWFDYDLVPLTLAPETYLLKFYI